MSTLGALITVVVSLLAMELVAVLTHRYVMHGWGWGWHRSHHEPHVGGLERNDLYAVVFAALAIALFAIGSAVWPPLFWVAVGVTLYGALYFIVHDGLVHQRWPFRQTPRRGYLKRLVQAHRLHHAVTGREGAVSFGFLWAPPIPRLREQLRATKAATEAGDRGEREARPASERPARTP
jgi:beta-carotene 3-hydroxylase